MGTFTGQKPRAVCPICEEVIKGTNGRKKGQDAIFCEGECQSWMHRHCAGLSKNRFQELSSSQDMFLCPACQNDMLTEAISELRVVVGELTSEIDELKKDVQRASVPKPTSNTAARDGHFNSITSLSKVSRSSLPNFFLPYATSNYTTCLLYTSPSPRDGLLSRMPSSA